MEKVFDVDAEADADADVDVDVDVDVGAGAPLCPASPGSRNDASALKQSEPLESVEAFQARRWQVERESGGRAHRVLVMRAFPPA